MELYLLFHSAAKRLGAENLKLARSLVGNYTTSLEMAGASITVSVLDEFVPVGAACAEMCGCALTMASMRGSQAERARSLAHVRRRNAGREKSSLRTLSNGCSGTSRLTALRGRLSLLGGVRQETLQRRVAPLGPAVQ